MSNAAWMDASEPFSPEEVEELRELYRTEICGPDPHVFRLLATLAKAKAPPAAKWQKDDTFVAWLIRVEYLRPDRTNRRYKKGGRLLPDGVYLYMWEAWLAAQADG